MALPIRASSTTRGPAIAVTIPAAGQVGRVERERQSTGTRSVAAVWQASLASSRTPPADPPAPFAESRACEAALLEDLLALLSALRLPADDLPERPVSVAALGAALAELERAERAASLPTDAIEARRRRLLALSGASAHLGALLDQRRRGLLPDGALHVRRAAILARLTPFFAADEA